MGVLACQRIEPPEVNAKPQRPILLSDQHHRVAPRTGTGADGSSIQHKFKMFSHLLHLGRGYASKSFPKRHRIGVHKHNFVLDRLGLPYFMLL
ncbi:MAG: hypothetical protein MJE68_32430 [Proteobacteria bacterium]|nr:hypothetical protein [Pseudomonadota bacterium]